MSSNLKSNKYCIIPFTTIDTIRKLKINKCPSKLGARQSRYKYTSKVNTKNLVHIQLGTEQVNTNNVRVGTANARSVKINQI